MNVTFFFLNMHWKYIIIIIENIYFVIYTLVFSSLCYVKEFI